MAVYKYSCRKCPIRNRCIKESNYTTSVKNMVRTAFEGRTDTLATWGLLQANCLLIKAEEEQARKAREESTLARRLREAREARQEAARKRAEKLGKDTDSLIRRLPQAQKKKEEKKKDQSEQPEQTPDYLRPVSPGSSSGFSSSSTDMPDVIGVSDAARERPPASTSKPAFKQPAKPCWFTVKGSGRHIVLPAAGQIVLGRFDATFGIPPDIDLAYEDGDNRTVSRRHAKVTGAEGYHTIEDTGSRYGVFVNGEQLQGGVSRQLKPGDRVAVGGIQMFYDQIPDYVQEIPKSTSVRHILIVTPTGRKLSFAPPDDIVIGRSDPSVDFVPDIDLNQDGEIAARVSRRHALIYWRDGKPHLEDLGSGFGTRVNGRVLLLGQSVPLRPGDHVWLGGCVLAYDIEM